uniref:ankyrin repeat and SOCS box protein 9-like isoform X3 n=1 Tax=Podarcis muralis TaxID=64176 RepID=UPI0010A09851|nr:ankyrin repeat and SOCS box protein 9-like isoform X3 [Podarcis muralis]
MDVEGANANAGISQRSESQPHPTYLPNLLMGDFVSDWSPLHDASIHGRLLALKKLIHQGSSVNLVTADCVSPLHEACLGGHSACASVLLKHGANVNMATIDWNTPLFNACVSGSVDCLNLLLQHGASPHAVCDLASPIHEAAKRGHTKCVEALVSHGVNIDHNIKHLGTPLYVACESQQEDCVKKLLESDGQWSGFQSDASQPDEEMLGTESGTFSMRSLLSHSLSSDQEYRGSECKYWERTEFPSPRGCSDLQC